MENGNITATTKDRKNKNWEYITRDMPTNVSIDYILAEKEYRNARTREEKIAALKKMISFCPKHKGTENLLKTLKERLSKLKKENEKGKRSHNMNIPKEGDAQVIILNFLEDKYMDKNATLIKKFGIELREINTKIRAFISILDYGGAKIQLIEIPGNYIFNEEKIDGFILNIIRNSEGIIIFIQETSWRGMLTEKINSILRNNGVIINKERKDITIRRSDGINIIGKEFIEDGNVEEIKREIEKNGIKNVEIIIKSPVKKEDVLLALRDNLKFIRGIYIIKGKESKEMGEVIKINEGFSNYEFLKEKIWEMLNLIRVYTKEPGKKEKRDGAIVLEKGATVKDVAENIHKDFVKKFRYARIWGKSAKFPGQRVGLQHMLQDKDIIEIHLR